MLEGYEFCIKLWNNHVLYCFEDILQSNSIDPTKTVGYNTSCDFDSGGLILSYCSNYDNLLVTGSGTKSQIRPNILSIDLFIIWHNKVSLSSQRKPSYICCPIAPITKNKINYTKSDYFWYLEIKILSVRMIRWMYVLSSILLFEKEF